MMGPEVAPAADKLVRLAEVVGWVRDYVKEGKFAAGTGNNWHNRGRYEHQVQSADMLIYHSNTVKQLAWAGLGTSTKSKALKS